jgi:hypothetical protein
MTRAAEPIEPMTLGNMRQLGVRLLDVMCAACRYEVVLNVDAWPDHMPVPAFGVPGTIPATASLGRRGMA